MSNETTINEKLSMKGSVEKGDKWFGINIQIAPF